MEKQLEIMRGLEVWHDERALAEVKRIYAPTLTEMEWKMFFGIGKSTGLNPFLREIFAVKYGNNPASIFIARDGYRKAAQNNPDYDYHVADAVYSNDEFKVENGAVKHVYSLKDRGDLIGAYCAVKRKGSTKPAFNFVELKEYDTKMLVWKTKPATMIKKVAESQGLRQTFQSVFGGTYDEEEMTPSVSSPGNAVSASELTALKQAIAAVETEAQLNAVREEAVAMAAMLTETEQRDLMDLIKAALERVSAEEVTPSATAGVPDIKKEKPEQPKEVEKVESKPEQKPIEEDKHWKREAATVKYWTPERIEGIITNLKSYYELAGFKNELLELFDAGEITKSTLEMSSRKLDEKLSQFKKPKQADKQTNSH